MAGDRLSQERWQVMSGLRNIIEMSQPMPFLATAAGIIAKYGPDDWLVRKMSPGA